MSARAAESARLEIV